MMILNLQRFLLNIVLLFVFSHYLQHPCSGSFNHLYKSNFIILSSKVDYITMTPTASRCGFLIANSKEIYAVSAIQRGDGYHCLVSKTARVCDALDDGMERIGVTTYYRNYCCKVESRDIISFKPTPYTSREFVFKIVSTGSTLVAFFSKKLLDDRWFEIAIGSSEQSSSGIRTNIGKRLYNNVRISLSRKEDTGIQKVKFGADSSRDVWISIQDTNIKVGAVGSDSAILMLPISIPIEVAYYGITSHGGSGTFYLPCPENNYTVFK